MSESAGELACDSANLNCLTLAQREGAGKHTCGQVNLGLSPYTLHAQPKKEKNEQGWATNGLWAPVHVCVSVTRRGSGAELGGPVLSKLEGELFGLPVE